MSVDYGAPKQTCEACMLKDSCTRNKMGRTIKRHLRQDEINQMRAKSRQAPSKKDIRTRKHLMERSFARSTRYGFDRARWRGVWRVAIQEYLVAAIQNIEVLIRYGRNPLKRLGSVIQVVKKRLKSAKTATFEPFISFSRVNISGYRFVH